MKFYSVLWLKSIVQPLMILDLQLCDVTLTAFSSRFRDTWGIADCEVNPDFVVELDHHLNNGTYKEYAEDFDLLVISFCVLFKEDGRLCKIDLIASVVVDSTSTEQEVQNHICKQVDELCSTFKPKVSMLN